MTDREEKVVLVDANDAETGTMEKLEAHRQGILHRAISVFVFDSDGRVLLQKRDRRKYHAQGQWANACCSHPAPGELPFAAARRRLREEMGFETTLRFLFRIQYRADVGNDLVEHELVHVFAGRYDGPVAPDPAEAEGYQWVTFDELDQQIERQPERFTPWLRIYLSEQGKALRATARP